MPLVTALLKSVKQRIITNLPAGLKVQEVVILPEAAIPANSGQRTLTIHPDKKTGVTPEYTTRKKVIVFGLSLSQRIRDIPNDRFDETTYMTQLAMSTVLEEIEHLIESESMIELFSTQLEIDNPGKYFISDTFRYLSTNFDPEHLYPSDYLTRNNKNDKEQLYDKISGFRMTSLFESPEIQLASPGYDCK